MSQGVQLHRILLGVDRFFVAHAVSRQVSRHPLADKPTGSLRIGVNSDSCSWHLFDPAF